MNGTVPLVRSVIAIRLLSNTHTLVCGIYRLPSAAPNLLPVICHLPSAICCLLSAVCRVGTGIHMAAQVVGDPQQQVLELPHLAENLLKYVLIEF
jgi:hypothetical protein